LLRTHHGTASGPSPAWRFIQHVESQQLNVCDGPELKSHDTYLEAILTYNRIWLRLIRTMSLRPGRKADEAQAKSNFKTHGVSFELAKTVFDDAFAFGRLDDRADYGEQRFVILGMAEGQTLLLVAYTEREDRIRIISARRATKHEQNFYFEQNASTDVH
jgi:uncharacterized DUF497 family protein